MSDGSPSPDLQIAENLIVGAVFLDDIDHVLDRILAAGELDCPGIAVQEVVVLDDAGEFVELAERGGNIQPRDRAPQQRGNVGMLVMSDLPCRLAHPFVRACALALGGRDQEIVAVNGERAGVPVGGDESESRVETQPLVDSDQSIENRDGVERCIGDEKKLAVGGFRQRDRIGSRSILLLAS